MTPPVPDDALTAVTRRPRQSTGMKALALFVGFTTPVCSAAAGYYAYRQSRVEAGVDTRRVRGEADVGYQTLATPVELLTTLAKTHETRIQQLEAEMRECAARQSLPPAPPAAPPTLVPLVRLRPLPRTLDEATAAAR